VSGAVTDRAEEEATENPRTFIRWFMLNAWVTDERRIHVTFVIDPAFGVPTVNVWP
jgi:hypothetical protein